MIDLFKTHINNRRLTRDLRAADNLCMQQLDEIAELRATVKDKQAIIDKQHGNINKLRAERTKIRKQIRDQTGADLLVNALRELGMFPKPEKYDSFKEAARLQDIANQQNRALGQSMSEIRAGHQSGSPLANALGQGFL